MEAGWCLHGDKGTKAPAPHSEQGLCFQAKPSDTAAVSDAHFKHKGFTYRGEQVTQSLRAPYMNSGVV